MIRFVKFLIGIILGIFFKIELVNIENVPQEGGAILCANHIGFYDMFFIGYKLKRLIRWMAKEELFRNPILKALLNWVGAFPIKRGKADIESIKTAIRLLDEGEIVGIFPQGTRIGAKDWKKIRIKNGAAMLMIKTGVPIIPVLIQADYKLFSAVKVIFGKPFHIEVDKEKKHTNEELREISLNIMESVYSLSEEN